jgi:putative ABC transport system permease protein
MSAQLVSVQEKSREYGIRRAVGVSARRLSREVVLETLGLTLAASIVGIVVGLASAYGLSAAMSRWVTPWPFEIIRWSVVAALGAGVVAGLAAAYLPARRASRLAIVDCLRSA